MITRRLFGRSLGEHGLEVPPPQLVVPVELLRRGQSVSLAAQGDPVFGYHAAVHYVNGVVTPNGTLIAELPAIQDGTLLTGAFASSQNYRMSPGVYSVQLQAWAPGTGDEQAKLVFVFCPPFVGALSLAALTAAQKRLSIYLSETNTLPVLTVGGGPSEHSFPVPWKCQVYFESDFASLAAGFDIHIRAIFLPVITFEIGDIA